MILRLAEALSCLVRKDNKINIHQDQRVVQYTKNTLGNAFLFRRSCELWTSGFERSCLFSYEEQWRHRFDTKQNNKMFSLERMKCWEPLEVWNFGTP
jgi:hypothetical protein